MALVEREPSYRSSHRVTESPSHRVTESPSHRVTESPQSAVQGKGTCTPMLQLIPDRSSARAKLGGNPLGGSKLRLLKIRRMNAISAVTCRSPATWKSIPSGAPNSNGVDAIVDND